MVGHRDVAVGDLRLHIAEEGAGPLVLLLHGFPECWYSWRHQFAPLAGAGYHVVAPDQRGYGRSDRPARAEEYTILHLVGDAIRGPGQRTGKLRAYGAGGLDLSRTCRPAAMSLESAVSSGQLRRTGWVNPR
jgi:hypothetical protein